MKAQNHYDYYNYDFRFGLKMFNRPGNYKQKQIKRLKMFQIVNCKL